MKKDIAEERKRQFFEQDKEKIYLVASSQSSEGAVVAIVSQADLWEAILSVSIFGTLSDSDSESDKVCKT